MRPTWTPKAVRNSPDAPLARPAGGASRVPRHILQAGPAVALLVLVVLFAVLNKQFLSLDNLGGIASQTSILLVIAVGMTFVILLGCIDLSVEGVMAASSLVFVLLAHNDRNGHDLGILAVLAGVLTGGLFGLANGLLHVRLRIPSFMVTLGTGAVGVGVATVLFGGQAPRLLDPGLRAWGEESWLGASRLAYLAVLVLLIGFFIQRYTRIGRYSYVIGGDEQIARLSGIKIARYKVLVFVLSGSASGLAGVMAAMQLGVGDVTIGSGRLFAAITAVVVGGTVLAGGHGGIGRSLVGAVLITVLANGLILVGVSPYIQTAVQGVVIVVAVAATGWSQRHRVRIVK